MIFVLIGISGLSFLAGWYYGMEESDHLVGFAYDQGVKDGELIEKFNGGVEID